LTDRGFALPYPPRPAWLAAFAATMGLWAAVVVGVLLPLTALPRIALAVAVGLLVAAALRVRRREGTMLYRFWVRASRLYARIARRALLLLTYAVLSVVGLAGNSLGIARPAAGRSLWHARGTLPPAAYGSQFDAPGRPWTGRPWRAVIDWAARSGNGWLLFVVPLLVLVSLLDTEDPDRYPPGIYTLF
jgi:hypothetical protein